MSIDKALRSEVANSDRLADRILLDLRGMILRGTLVQGAKLPTERDLSQRYGASGPTVREAIRGLSAMGLITVRHGSGAYVAADATSLISASLGTVIQLEKLGLSDVLSTVGGLLVHAAGQAAEAATETDRALLALSLDQLDEVTSPNDAAVALRAFHEAIAAAAHNALLRVLHGFLTNLVIELAIAMMDDNLTAWRRILNKVRPLRAALVVAIVGGDVAGATRLAALYHAQVTALVVSVPKAKEVRLKDPQFQALLMRLISGLGAR